MKPREQGGVVSEKLDVYGVRNLKVAVGSFTARRLRAPRHYLFILRHIDLSILPSNVGANTYNTTLAIGEKAALIIAEELGISGTMKVE